MDKGFTEIFGRAWNAIQRMLASLLVVCALIAFGMVLKFLVGYVIDKDSIGMSIVDLVMDVSVVIAVIVVGVSGIAIVAIEAGQSVNTFIREGRT